MKLTQLFNIKNILPVMTMLLVGLAGCDKDEDPGIRPVVESTNPADKATNIAINSSISSTFNVAMKASSITDANFTLKQGNTNVAGAVSYLDLRATFDPTLDLAPNTVYTATVTTGAKNTSGTGTAKDHVWTFTTGASADIIAPLFTLSNPANNETEVALNQAIAITFSEAMDKTSFTNGTFHLKRGSTAVDGEITYSGSTAKFTPDADLLPSTVYTITLTTGVKDLAGNPIAENKTLTFTSGGTKDILVPTLHSTSPEDDATNIARNKVITMTFSESMDPATINSSNFILEQGTNAVSGTVTYAGITASFTPSANLAAATTYKATIKTGAKDLAGNSLASNIVWEFTTSGTDVPLDIVNLGTSGNYVIVAKTAINNSSTSAIVGDLALSPAATSYITGLALTAATGYATSAQVTGKVYGSDMADPTPIDLTTAVENMLTAYNDAAGRPSPDFSELGTGNIGGKTLTPGLYKWTTTVTLPSDVTISGGANDVWIFQISGDLLASSAVNVTLEGGAQAKNIFWQVAGQATFGTTSHFEGVVLSKTGITFQTNASINGRALAQTAVVLDKNAITNP